MPGPAKNFLRASKLLRQPAPPWLGVHPFLAGETDFPAAGTKRGEVHPNNGAQTRHGTTTNGSARSRRRNSMSASPSHSSIADRFFRATVERPPAESLRSRAKWAVEKQPYVFHEALPAPKRHVGGRAIRTEPGEALGPLARDVAVMLDDHRPFFRGFAPGRRDCLGCLGPYTPGNRDRYKY